MMHGRTDRISRRGALRAGIAAAAACTAWPAFAVRPVGDPWIRKALKIGMISGGESLATKFRLAREAGFLGVELDSPGPYSEAEVADAKAATGLEVPGVVLSTHWSQPFNHPDASVRRAGEAALEEALRACRAYGGTSVLVVPAVVNEGMPYAEAYELSQAAMRRAAPLAADLGVRIAFENVWNQFLLSPLEAARYSDELNERSGGGVFGWQFDIGNVVNFGWPEQWIDVLGSRIVRLDVKDFSRAKRDAEGLWKGFGVKIGDGDAGWGRVRAALRRIGYTGWAAAEVAGGDADRLAEIARRMDDVFDQA